MISAPPSGRPRSYWKTLSSGEMSGRPSTTVLVHCGLPRPSRKAVSGPLFSPFGDRPVLFHRAGEATRHGTRKRLICHCREVELSLVIGCRVTPWPCHSGREIEHLPALPVSWGWGTCASHAFACLGRLSSQLVGKGVPCVIRSGFILEAPSPVGIPIRAYQFLLPLS
jgi:hypothetical protein